MLDQHKLPKKDKEKDAFGNADERNGSIMESFIHDPILLQEYKDLFLPFKKKGHYTIFYSTLCFIGAFHYIKNIKYYIHRNFKTRKEGVSSLLKLSFLHIFAFFCLFLGGNFLILGIRPIKFIKKMRSIEERILSQDISHVAAVEYLENIIQMEKFGIIDKNEEKLEDKNKKF